MASLLSVPAAAQDRFQRGSVQWNGKAAPRGAALIRPAMLEVHNAARRDYGVEPLTWSPALANDALIYAKRLATTQTFAHDTQKRTPVQGENLYMGTRGAWSYAGMAQLWVDERRDFKPGRFPDVTKRGHWSRVGHYTQIIWPTTREVGCAIVASAKDDYLVCRYLPAGNYYGSVLK